MNWIYETFNKVAERLLAGVHKKLFSPKSYDRSAVLAQIAEAEAIWKWIRSSQIAQKRRKSE